MKKALMVLGIILISMVPVVILASTVYTLMLPNIYQSTAVVSVRALGGAGCPNPCEHCGLSASALIQTEMAILESKPILHEVIKRLDLQSEWGRDREKLPRSVACKILRNSINISNRRNSPIVEISVRRDNPDEAADIANEMVATYRDAKRAQAKMDSVELIDIAEPNRRPVSPNLFLNTLLSVAFALGMGIVGLILLLAGLNKKPPPVPR